MARQNRSHLSVSIDLQASAGPSNVADQPRRRQLLDYMTHRTDRNVGRIVQEGAQKAHGGQLNRHPDTVVVPTSSSNELKIGLIKMEERPSCADVGSPLKRR